MVSAARACNICAAMRPAAVVVTFNPEAAVAQRLKAIARECRTVYVVDNGSTETALKALRKAAKAAKAKLIELGTNTGIAHAQNVGLILAFKNKSEAVILFDHDSTPRPGFAAALLRTAAALRRPAIVGSRIHDVNMQSFAKHPCRGGLFFARSHCPEDGMLTEALMVIASGTLLTRDVHEQLGGMREDFFIDYVDWEYCLRARAKFGVPTVICGAAVLDHARGERVGRRVLGITVHPPGYSPMRYEHIFRNRARLFRTYFFRNRAFICFELVAIARDFFLLLFEKQSVRLMRLAARSWFSGFKRRAV